MYCNKCGKQLPDDVCFCNDCGAQLNVLHMPVQTAAPKKKPFIKMITIVLAVLAVVAVVILGAIRIFGEKNTPVAVVERYGKAIMEDDMDLCLECFHEDWFKLLCERSDMSAEEYKEELSWALSYEMTNNGALITDFYAFSGRPATYEEASYSLQSLKQEGYTVSDAQYVTCFMKQTDAWVRPRDLLVVKIKGKWYLSPEYLDIDDVMGYWE